MDIAFNENKDRFFNCLPHNHFIIELTKCCNYTEWIIILKNYTIQDLYRQIKEIFKNHNIRLYVKDIYQNVLQITESDMTIRNLIHINPSFFKPVYPIPHAVVYKIYIDDGVVHEHN